MEDVEQDLLHGPIPTCAKVPSFDCETEGLKYVAGYIASKFIKKYPELGQKTSEFLLFERTTSPWISSLSKGGLVLPSEEFLSKIYQMEIIFQAVHSDTISGECNVIKKLSKLLKRDIPSVPEEVLNKFAKTWTFIRLKFLNCNLKLSQTESVA